MIFIDTMYIPKLILQ